MKKVLFFISFLMLILISNAQSTVKYTVTCNPAGFNVTYTNGNGIVEKKIISDSVWISTFYGFSGETFSIVAQSNSTNSIIKVKVEYENYTTKQDINYGNYPIVTTSGKLK